MLFSAAAAFYDLHLLPPSILSTFHRLLKICKHTVGSMHAAQSCLLPGTGTPPAPYPCSHGQTAAGSWQRLPTARPPNTSTCCIPLCTPQTSPPAQPNPPKGFKGKSVFAVCRGLTMLSLLTHHTALGSLGDGMRGAGCIGGEHSPILLLCCFSCRNFQQICPSGWTGRTSLESSSVWSRCCCATACYVYPRAKRHF